MVNILRACNDKKCLAQVNKISLSLILYKLILILLHHHLRIAQKKRFLIVMSTNKLKAKSFNEGLKALEEKKLDTLGNVKAIADHQKPLALSYALCALHKYQLLTSENRNWLKAKSQPQDISNALNAIGVKLATQENLNTLLTLKNSEFTEHSGYLFYRIPENKFSQSVFDQIIELSQTTDSIRQINRFIDQLLTKTISIDKRQSTLFLSSTTSDSGIINDHSQNKLTR